MPVVEIEADPNATTPAAMSRVFKTLTSERVKYKVACNKKSDERRKFLQQWINICDAQKKDIGTAPSYASNASILQYIPKSHTKHSGTANVYSYDDQPKQTRVSGNVYYPDIEIPDVWDQWDSAIKFVRKCTATNKIFDRLNRDTKNFAEPRELVPELVFEADKKLKIPYINVGCKGPFMFWSFSDTVQVFKCQFEVDGSSHVRNKDVYIFIGKMQPQTISNKTNRLSIGFGVVIMYREQQPANTNFDNVQNEKWHRLLELVIVPENMAVVNIDWGIEPNALVAVRLHNAIAPRHIVFERKEMMCVRRAIHGFDKMDAALQRYIVNYKTEQISENGVRFTMSTYFNRADYYTINQHTSQESIAIKLATGSIGLFLWETSRLHLRIQTLKHLVYALFLDLQYPGRFANTYNPNDTTFVDIAMELEKDALASHQAHIINLRTNLEKAKADMDAENSDVPGFYSYQYLTSKKAYSEQFSAFKTEVSNTPKPTIKKETPIWKAKALIMKHISAYFHVTAGLFPFSHGLGKYISVEQEQMVLENLMQMFQTLYDERLKIENDKTPDQKQKWSFDDVIREVAEAIDDSMKERFADKDEIEKACSRIGFWLDNYDHNFSINEILSCDYAVPCVVSSMQCPLRVNPVIATIDLSSLMEVAPLAFNAMRQVFPYLRKHYNAREMKLKHLSTLDARSQKIKSIKKQRNAPVDASDVLKPTACFFQGYVHQLKRYVKIESAHYGKKPFVQAFAAGSSGPPLIPSLQDMHPSLIMDMENSDSESESDDSAAAADVAAAAAVASATAAAAAAAPAAQNGEQDVLPDASLGSPRIDHVIEASDRGGREGSVLPPNNPPQDSRGTTPFPRELPPVHGAVQPDPHGRDPMQRDVVREDDGDEWLSDDGSGEMIEEDVPNPSFSVDDGIAKYFVNIWPDVSKLHKDFRPITGKIMRPHYHSHSRGNTSAVTAYFNQLVFDCKNDNDFMKCIAVLEDPQSRQPEVDNAHTTLAGVFNGLFQRYDSGFGSDTLFLAEYNDFRTKVLKRMNLYVDVDAMQKMNEFDIGARYGIYFKFGFFNLGYKAVDINTWEKNQKDDIAKGMSNVKFTKANVISIPMEMLLHYVGNPQSNFCKFITTSLPTLLAALQTEGVPMPQIPSQTHMQALMMMQQDIDYFFTTIENVQNPNLMKLKDTVRMQLTDKVTGLFAVAGAHLLLQAQVYSSIILKPIMIMDNVSYALLPAIPAYIAWTNIIGAPFLLTAVNILSTLLVPDMTSFVRLFIGTALTMYKDDVRYLEDYHDCSVWPHNNVMQSKIGSMYRNIIIATQSMIKKIISSQTPVNETAQTQLKKFDRELGLFRRDMMPYYEALYNTTNNADEFYFGTEIFMEFDTGDIIPIPVQSSKVNAQSANKMISLTPEEYSQFLTANIKSDSPIEIKRLFFDVARAYLTEKDIQFKERTIEILKLEDTIMDIDAKIRDSNKIFGETLTDIQTRVLESGHPKATLYAQIINETIEWLIHDDHEYIDDGASVAPSESGTNAAENDTVRISDGERNRKTGNLRTADIILDELKREVHENQFRVYSRRRVKSEIPASYVPRDSTAVPAEDNAPMILDPVDGSVADLERADGDVAEA